MANPDDLEQFLLRLREDRTLSQNVEEATCQGIILPMLAHLGWDRDNVREVVPQFPVENGRVDYCLKIGDKNAVFIEVKRTNEELEQRSTSDSYLNTHFIMALKLQCLLMGSHGYFTFHCGRGVGINVSFSL